ncbi:hypothetical protein GIB67_018983, partial [Kingdonia uniflora]
YCYNNNSSRASPSLEEKFGRKVIVFTKSGNVPSVKLTVKNGSSLCIRIPDGIVTSYKPKVYWKEDRFVEVLYTIPVAGSSDFVKGGIGLVLNDVSGASSSSKGSEICTSKWVVKDVYSDSIDALQVELSCTCVTLEINYIISLYPLSMATAVTVQNNGRKPGRELVFRVIRMGYDDIYVSCPGFSSQNCVVKMGLENGSFATLMPSSSLITSYKAHMWHGATIEVLHTTFKEGEDGTAVIQGGLYGFQDWD